MEYYDFYEGVCKERLHLQGQNMQVLCIGIYVNSITSFLPKETNKHTFKNTFLLPRNTEEKNMPRLTQAHSFELHQIKNLAHYIFWWTS